MKTDIIELYAEYEKCKKELNETKRILNEVKGYIDLLEKQLQELKELDEGKTEYSFN
jgi:DNA repair ATPase RecN